MQPLVHRARLLLQRVVRRVVRGAQLRRVRRELLGVPQERKDLGGRHILLELGKEPERGRVQHAVLGARPRAVPPARDHEREGNREHEAVRAEHPHVVLALDDPRRERDAERHLLAPVGVAVQLEVLARGLVGECLVRLRELDVVRIDLLLGLVRGIHKLVRVELHAELAVAAADLLLGRGRGDAEDLERIVHGVRRVLRGGRDAAHQVRDERPAEHDHHAARRGVQHGRAHQRLHGTRLVPAAVEPPVRGALCARKERAVRIRHQERHYGSQGERKELPALVIVLVPRHGGRPLACARRCSTCR